MKSLSLSLVSPLGISWYRMSRSNTIYLNCSAVNFSLHATICEYLMSLSIIISIESYLSPVAGFVDLGNLIIKFIVTSSHGDSGDS